MQTIPAAACARSLLETAAAFWVDTRNFRDLWREVKTNSAKATPKLQHWYELNLQIWKMIWGAKFDKKMPDLAEKFRQLERTNVLTQIDKLDRVTESTV